MLPVFDAKHTLDACLRSIARQTVTELECVIVDDGSRDGSLEIAKAFAERDPRFRVIAAPHAGVSAATNRGIAGCRAPFVARMDADDWMHRERLARQLAAFDADPRLDAVGTRVRYFPRSRVGPGLREYETWLNRLHAPRRVHEDAYIECPVANPTLMFRAERLRALGGYHDPDWPEDYDLVLRLLEAGGRLGGVRARLHGWRVHDARLTHTSPRYDVARFTACKAHHLARGFLARHREYLLWGYGRTGRTLAKALRAHEKHAVAIVELHPGRLGQTIQGASVISPHALGPPGRRPLLVSVAGAEPRALIRQELRRLGWRELVDFRCAANGRSRSNASDTYERFRTTPKRIIYTGRVDTLPSHDTVPRGTRRYRSGEAKCADPYSSWTISFEPAGCSSTSSATRASPSRKPATVTTAGGSSSTRALTWSSPTS